MGFQYPREEGVTCIVRDNFPVFSLETYCDPSKEQSCQNHSNERPQHMFFKII